MYRAKQIDDEWVVVDDSDEIVNSDVDGRISAVTTAARMNREESEGESNVKVHRGNSYGNKNDEELDEDTDYYKSQFSRLKSGPNMEEYAIQVRDNEGNKTNWMKIYRPALDKIKSLMSDLDKPDEQRMQSQGNEVKEAFGKEGKISPSDASDILVKFDNKDFFTLNSEELSELMDLKKKYKYRQSKLSGASGRSELRSFYYYLQRLADKWEKSSNVNNSNNKNKSETNNESINDEEIDEAIKLYTPDTDVEELELNQLKDYIKFIEQKIPSIKDESEKQEFQYALDRAKGELKERESQSDDDNLNESLISTIYKTIKYL